MSFFERKNERTSKVSSDTWKALARSSQFLACLVILVVLERIPNANLAAARITLPVIRSYSQLESSGVKGNRGMTVEHGAQLRKHDYLRSRVHKRMLTSVVDFPLAGNEYSIGLYYTVIGLGTPSESYFVQVDTGSDLLWVNCKPCSVCPTDSSLPIELRLYDPAQSTTSANTSCSSSLCQTISNFASQDNCVDNSCYYGFGYGDGSQTMGYLVEDMLKYDVVGTNSSTNASASVVFGCGFNQSGPSLTGTKDAVDGIMGFGQDLHSVVSQLADSGLVTNEFAHCLQGDVGDGGIFVIGDIQEPGIVYTPMVAKTSHYNVGLKSISVDGKILDIPSSSFAVSGTNREGGTIIDSGTTLALFVDEAYDAFLQELYRVTTATRVYLQDAEGIPCFEVSQSDFQSSFPKVNLTFDGASMALDPTNYLSLYRSGGRNQDQVWCLSWSKSSQSGLSDTTILGDIVLKNKLVVYDIQNQQIGWVDYDCQSSVDVASGTGTSQVDPKNVDGNFVSSLSLSIYHTVLVMICSMVLAYVVACR